MIAAVGGLALAGAPEALADPIPVAPAEEAEFTARVGQIAFQATVDAISPPRSRAGWTSASRGATSPSGVLPGPDDFSAGPDASVPPGYQGGPDSDANWPNRPGTYYWQAGYNNCAPGRPELLQRDQIADHRSAGAAHPQTPRRRRNHPLRRRGDLLGPGRPLLSSGQHAHRHRVLQERRPELRRDLCRPRAASPAGSAGGGVYRYRLGQPITDTPGTYYWIVERFDCSAEGPRLLRDGRRDPILHREPSGRHTGAEHHAHPPPAAPNPQAQGQVRVLLQHARRVLPVLLHQGVVAVRDRRRGSGASKPGRYRFKVRAVANGKRDLTPASWLFRVLRRR